MKKYIPAPPILMLICIYTLANFWHVIVSFIQRVPNTYFIGIPHYHPDFFYYLSQVTQGKMGVWMSSNLFTTDSIPPAPLWLHNILLGKIAAVFNLESWTVYNWALVVTCIASIYALYFVIQKTVSLPKYIFPALLITLSANSYFKITNFSPFSIESFGFFYNYTASLNRLGGVYHLILQNIFSLISMYITSKQIHMGSSSPSSFRALQLSILQAIMLLFLLLINPMYALVNGTLLALSFFVDLLNRFTTKRLFYYLSHGLIVTLPLVPVAILINQTFTHPFYQYFRAWEANIPPTNYETFLLSLGLIGPLMLLGIPLYASSLTPMKITGLFAVFVPMLLYFSPIPRMLALPVFRILQPPSYAFMGILAVYGVETITRGILKILTLSKLTSAISSINRSFCRLFHLPSYELSETIFYKLILIFFLLQLPVLFVEINNRAIDSSLARLNNLSPTIYNALTALKNETEPGSAIALNNLEYITPVISGKKVYAAHSSLTPNYPTKIQEVIQLYHGIMSPTEAKTFLKTNAIRYIVYTNEEGQLEDFIKKYPFITTIYRNADASILAYIPTP